jgi:hypothetical protein
VHRLQPSARNRKAVLTEPKPRDWAILSGRASTSPRIRIDLIPIQMVIM